MDTNTETIAALASASGPAGVAVIRVSGPDVPDIAIQLLGHLPEPRVAELARFPDVDGAAIDRGIALYFPAPYSFTGEHVLELHGHGSPVLEDMLLARLVALGARLAGPGEFSERAFLNGKLSLDQAEAIADAISAGSRISARAAMRSLEGVFSREIRSLVDALTRLRVYTEAAIDFPDEDDVDFLQDGQIETRLSGIMSRLETLRARAAEGAGFRDGLRLVILGRPNVGKSSLLNRMTRRETAIVTHMAGTTRDVLREQLSIGGVPLTLVDTAGLRETEDLVEAEGVRRARNEMSLADHALFVFDDSRGLTGEDKALIAGIESSVGMTLIANKIDLTGEKPGVAGTAPDGKKILRVSAIDGAGMDTLTHHLKTLAGVGGMVAGEPAFIARRRHLVAMERAADALEAGHERWVADAAGDLLAEELRAAQDALGEITGQVTSDDLLGEIFSSFCIGK